MFCSGGGNAPAGTCLRKLPALCIAAAPLLRLRLRSNVLLPEFLAWYLRQKTAQVYFEGNAQGSAMRMVGIDVLENLMIPVIPLEKQQKIIELVELFERERELAQKLIALKSVYINKTVNQWLGE
ncbi:MAG: restriction endonuclease subunit S [Victivallales bacterium]